MNIWTNFADYGLPPPLGLLRCDLHTAPFRRGMRLRRLCMPGGRLLTATARPHAPAPTSEPLPTRQTPPCTPAPHLPLPAGPPCVGCSMPLCATLPTACGRGGARARATLSGWCGMWPRTAPPPWPTRWRVGGRWGQGVGGVGSGDEVQSVMCRVGVLCLIRCVPLPHRRPPSSSPPPHTLLAECLHDLLECAAKLLRTGGRLVYFMPAAPGFYTDDEVPQHPALEVGVLGGRCRAWAQTAAGLPSHA